MALARVAQHLSPKANKRQRVTAGYYFRMMIAIDTNVLLQHVLQDDAVQSPKASRLIKINNRVLITDVVLLVETIWTLLGKKYQATRDDIIKLVSDLLAEHSIQFENPHAIWGALSDFQKDRPLYDDKGRKLKCLILLMHLLFTKPGC